MSRIAILHPQCSIKGGAIQMALQTIRALQAQGHTTTLYTFEKSPDCFPDLQEGISIEIWHKKTGGKLINIITLAWHLRHFDMIIANNPPMQIVAALAKVFSRRKVQTVWWHHHVPWYLPKEMKNDEGIMKNGGLFMSIKRFFEKNLVISFIDQMVATSHFVAEKLREYCGRDSVVIHPVIQSSSYDREKISQQPRWTNNDGRITIFTHGRLEAGKGLDMLTRVFDKIQSTEYKGQNAGNIQLIIFGTGSLETKLREEGRDVRPFRGEETFSELSTGKYGHVISVYCSSIDAFGMASLESQMAGFETIIMDSGGASEAILSDDHDEPVGYLVHTEEELLRTIGGYVQNKIPEKQLSNVNFSHKRDYFSPSRLSSDLLSLMSKTRP